MVEANGIQLADGTTVKPSLVGGPITNFAPTFSASGSRLLAASGQVVLCFATRTAQLIGKFAEHSGQVTAVCSAPRHPDGAEPIASGTSTGELKLWDAKTLSCLASLSVGGPVVALSWPQAQTLLVITGSVGRPASVKRIEIQSLTSPGLSDTSPPISSQCFKAVDALDDIVAMTDGEQLVVWCQRDQRSRNFSHQVRLTAVSIDPQKRYIVVGDAQGNIWTWWGILDDGASKDIAPARFRWHSKPVLSLTHLGPLLLSGGYEGVICIRRADEVAPKFKPRFQGPLLHMVTSSSGKICVSVADNSVAFVDNLHDWIKPRWIRSLDLPLVRHKAKKSKRQMPAMLHPLSQGSLVATCSSGRRVHLINEKMGLLKPRSIPLGTTSNFTNRSHEERWHLRMAAFSVDGNSIMTWETRSSLAVGEFDEEIGEVGVLKWWSCGGQSSPEEYSLDTLSYSAHAGEVTVALALPQRKGLFVSASIEGFFKCWECLPVEGDTTVSNCWQCIGSGGWRNRAIQCGCASVDGSILALGCQGAIVLFGPETGEELGVLPLTDDSEKNGRVLQLFCVVACERLLLMAIVQNGAGGEYGMCWDLGSFMLIARVSLQGILPGVGVPRLRVADNEESSTDLRLLASRAATEDLQSKGSTKILLWRWSWRSGATLEGFANEIEVEATLPSKVELLDLCFLGGGSTNRILVWTSSLELWGIDFAKSDKKSIEVEEIFPTEDGDGERGQLSRVLGERTTSNTKPLAELLGLPFRTTPNQQAGLTAALLDRVIPASAPSHNLPPPALIWAGCLGTWGKALHGTSLAKDSDSTSGITQNPSSHAEKHIELEESNLPLWAQRGPTPDEICKAEFVDATFAEELVKEAFRTS